MLLGARQFFERRGAPTPPGPYDAEVEYIGSTGTQLITTNIIAERDIQLECRGQWTSQPTSQTHAIWGGSSGRARFCWSTNNTGTFFGYGATSSPISDLSYDANWHDVKLYAVLGSQTVTVDGTTYPGSAFTTNIILSNISFFGNASVKSSFRLAYCKITKPSTGAVIGDFIPVRFTNELGQSEGAMYDRVSGALFRNAGKGAFTIGPDK